MDKSIKKVAFIGAGNVAWHLSKAIQETGCSITDVYSRDIENATKLCDRLKEGNAKNDLDFSTSKAQLIIISVSDDALPDLVKQIELPENRTIILAHTSGSFPLSVISNIHFSAGVFYPLQTFSKHKEINLSTTPILLEVNQVHEQKALVDLANKISGNVQMVNSEGRQSLHIAAVFACNFTNHLLAIAEEILKEKYLDFKLLEPLIRETITKSLTHPPKTGQTGPAIRNDEKVIKKHLLALKENASYQQLYELLTRSIQRHT